MKHRAETQKGFTLIELMVVVGIIGLLSSVVMVSLQSARLKGKDAFLRQQAVQMRTIMEQEYSETGSYLGLSPSAWINSQSQCDTVSFTGNYVSQARSICKAILQHASVSWAANKFYLGVQSAPPNKYSIMIALPHKDTYLCLGSSGANSDDTTSSTMWTRPGCWSNP